jgi:hypothetical protein
MGEGANATKMSVAPDRCTYDFSKNYFPRSPTQIPKLCCAAGKKSVNSRNTARKGGGEDQEAAEARAMEVRACAQVIKS